MTLIEALKSGQRFKRPRKSGWADETGWCYVDAEDNICTTWGIIHLPKSALLATDWEIEGAYGLPAASGKKRKHI